MATSSRYHFRDVPSFGEKLGSSLGAGLGGGLAQLADAKLNTLLTRNQRDQDKQRLMALGMPEEEATYVSTLDSDKQWQYAHRYLITKGSPEENIFPSSLDEELRITPEMEQQAEDQVRSMGIEIPGKEQGQQQQPQNAAQLLSQQAPMSEIMRNQLEKTQIQQPQNAMQALQQESVQAAPQPQVAQIPEPPQEEVPLPLEKKRKERPISEVFRQERALQEKPKAAAKKSESKANAKAIDRAYQAIDTADSISSIADQMSDLLASGKVANGLAGRVTPKFLQSDETQVFESLSNELASMIASRSGVATNFKIKLAQSMKPNIEQNPGTQKALVGKLKESAKKLKAAAQDRLQGNDVFEELPTEGIAKGTQAVNEETGQKLVFDGQRWVGAK